MPRLPTRPPAKARVRRTAIARTDNETPLEEAELQYERSQWPFWTFVLTLIVGLLYLFSPILMPFVAGAIIAYFMDPFVDLLEKRRIPRWAGTVIALVLFTLLIALLITLLVPMIKTQVEALLNAAPGYAAKVKSSFLPWAQRYLNQLDPDAVTKLQDAAGDSAGDIVGGLANGLKALLSKGFALFDLLALLIVTPIVAFYLLRDWDQIVDHIDRRLPRRHAATIHAEAAKIDRSLSGFMHGQALVCLSLGTYYAIMLSIVGLDYGATIGIIVGVLSFVPYVGGITGFICSTGLALIQFDSFSQVLLVVAIYFVGQILEGNVISPKLVGDRIGLHPVWIIFAVMAGGSLFGFVGVLVALPVAAILGVLIRFALTQYLQSRYYLKRA